MEIVMTNFLSSLFKSSCFCGSDSVAVKSKKFYVKDIIGQGGFSTVYLVKDKENKKLYALKKVICHSVLDETFALNEVNTHEKIQHDNVIQLIDYELKGSADPHSNCVSQLYLLLPYYKRGTLHQELEYRAALKKAFDPVELLQIFLKICSGVKAFHQLEEPLAHRDLKTSNILLDMNYAPVIMDLGSAAIARVNISKPSDAQSLQDLAAERCSMPYKAPELFNVEKNSIIDERTDIWSLGCVLYAMCFFKSPFDIVYERGDSVALAVLSGNINFPEKHIYGKNMEELILYLLKVNPEDRPFIDDVIEKVESTLKEYLIPL